MAACGMIPAPLRLPRDPAASVLSVSFLPFGSFKELLDDQKPQETRWSWNILPSAAACASQHQTGGSCGLAAAQRIAASKAHVSYLVTPSCAYADKVRETGCVEGCAARPSCRGSAAAAMA